MRKFNNYICIGLLFNGLGLFSNRFLKLPDFFIGLCFGLGIGLVILGLYIENHDISKIKNFKRNIFIKDKKSIT